MRCHRIWEGMYDLDNAWLLWKKFKVNMLKMWCFYSIAKCFPCNYKHFEDLLVWQYCNWFSWLIHNLWSLQIEHECLKSINKNHFDFRMTDHIWYEQHLQQYACSVQKFPENRITFHRFTQRQPRLGTKDINVN